MCVGRLVEGDSSEGDSSEDDYVKDGVIIDANDCAAAGGAELYLFPASSGAGVNQLYCNSRVDGAGDTQKIYYCDDDPKYNEYANSISPLSSPPPSPWVKVDNGFECNA